METTLFFQILGLLFLASGGLGLSIYTIIVGHTSRYRNALRSIVPLNAISISFAILFIAGVFLLTQTGFEPCNFLAQVWPELRNNLGAFICGAP